MVSRKILFVLCVVLSILCLAAGYAMVGHWVGAVIVIITGLCWIPARKDLGAWLPHLCLFAFVFLAVVGRLTGSTTFLMVCGSGLALAAWDLFFLDEELKGSTYGEQTRRFENKHLQSLTLALGFGLMAAFVGRLLNFQIPFAILMLFVLMVVFGLDRVWGYTKKRKMHIA
jgi:hypothetical protein